MEGNKIFNELLMFSSSSRLKLDNMKLYTMLQEVDIDVVISLIFYSKINYNINW